jgi:hypothetical protein
MPKPEVAADVPMVKPERLPRHLVGRKPPQPSKTVDQALDEALADSFPASDPVSFLQPSPKDRPKP